MGNYNLDRINFLIVDDNRHMRTLVKTILHALGAKHIQEAEDGSDAFREMRTFAADLVICDWNMEPLDGLDFVRLMRTGSDSPNPYVPIIMLTGHTEMYRVTEARDAGVNEFLAKPISAKRLYTKLQSVIERPRPFVNAKRYFGPCRRRRRDPKYGGPERRADASDSDPGLSQTDVEALLSGAKPGMATA